MYPEETDAHHSADVVPADEALRELLRRTFRLPTLVVGGTGDTDRQGRRRRDDTVWGAEVDAMWGLWCGRIIWTCCEKSSVICLKTHYYVRHTLAPHYYSPAFGRLFPGGQCRNSAGAGDTGAEEVIRGHH